MNVARLVRVRWVLGALLIAAAALFAFGIATEGDVHHPNGSVHVVAGEADESAEPAGAHDERREVAETGEGVLGVNLESGPLVAVAVVISLVLAAATWRRDDKWLLVVTAAFAGGFAVLDIAEFSHQIARPAAALATIAAVIAGLHALAAFVAERRRHLLA